MRKTWLFRCFVITVPTAIGLIAILITLAHKGMLVVDSRTGWPKFQQAPIYLAEPGYQATGHCYQHDALLGWRNIPNWQATTWGCKLTINSQGLRDREYAFKKPARTKRILVLGDSYAWGYGVADDETFSEQLETRLTGWQVLNAGVSGWGTDQEFLYFREEGIDYSPDVVILALFLFNDPENNVHSVQYGLEKPLFVTTELQLTNVPVPTPGTEPTEIQSDVAPIEITVAIIDELAALCAAVKCQLIVMKFGAFLNLRQQQMARWQQTLETHLDQMKHVHYLDLDDEFAARSISKNELLVGNDDDHWNAFGHKQTAIVLKEFLSSKRLLP